jgi:hypothetical protein
VWDEAWCHRLVASSTAAKPIIKFEPGHAGHSSVRYQTRGPLKPAGLQEMLGPLKRFCVETYCPDKINDTVPNALIIVDDWDYMLHCHLALHLRCAKPAAA